MTSPLTGITVVAFEQAVAAPYCTRLLGDLGARVIKVERPGSGDPARYYDTAANGVATHFAWLNRNKESLTLDFKTAAGRAVLGRLFDRADVVVQNLAPGTAHRLGIDAKSLVGARPALVAVDMSGYGTGGPLDHRRAYDLLVQAEAGACAITGEDGHPVKPGPLVADVGNGLQAAVSILAALVARRTSGEGAAIEVGMFDTVADFIGFALLHARYTGQERPPIGMSSPVVAPYGAYPTRDGRTVVLGTTNDAEWRRLAGTVLSRPDLLADETLATNEQRCAQRARLDAAVAKWTSSLDLAEVMTRADAAGIGSGAYRGVLDVVEHPQLTARRRWQQVDSPGGPLASLLPPFVSERWPVPLRAVPALGEHTGAILTELGVSEQEQHALRVVGAVSPGPGYAEPVTRNQEELAPLDRLRALDSCAVSDALDTIGLPGATTGIGPLWAVPAPVAGRVRTVLVGPRRSDRPAQHVAAAAIEAADPGDVLVIANGGRTDVSSWGGILTLAARQRGIGGVVIDGACRDIAESAEQGFPVYGRAMVPVSARGRIVQLAMDEPVEIAGVTVSPGDAVLADANGVVFIPAHSLDRVVLLAERITARERQMADAIRAGQPVTEVMHDSRFPTISEAAETP